MSYHCLDCGQPLNQPCNQHKTSERHIRTVVLKCGHLTHHCCLGSLCKACQAPVEIIKGFLLNQKVTPDELQHAYYRTLRQQLKLDLPLDCIVCRGGVETPCRRHTRENTGFIATQCGHVSHRCCQRTFGDRCGICFESPVVTSLERSTQPKSRKSLEGLYRRTFKLDNLQTRQIFGWDEQEIGDRYFQQELPEPHAKYCRCVLHVAAKQPDWCIQESAWRQKRNGDTCYNPYAVCTKSLGRKGALECFLNYDLEQVPVNETEALALLKQRHLKRHGLDKGCSDLRKLQKILMKNKV